MEQIITFGLYENYNKNIEQRAEGIFYINNNNDGKEIKTVLLDGVLTSIKYYIDDLGIVKNYYEVTYYNNLSKSETIFKGSLRDISKELETEADYIRTNNDLNGLIAEFKKQSINKGLLEVINYYSINGYFIFNNEFIDNNKYLINKYGMLSEVEIKEELQEVTELLKDYLMFIHNNFISICKYILISPFIYCFKQLKLQETNKILYLYGKQKAGKTTNILKLLSLYNDKDNMETTANSKASLNNDLNTLDTLPKLLDECFGLFDNHEVQELLTSSRFNINLRTTADKEKQGQNINYKSYNTIIGTTNQTNKTFEGLNRAMLYYKFDSSIFNDETKREYLLKYNNLDFSLLGFIFSKCIKKYIEAKDIIKYDNPVGVNNLINNVLTDIEKNYKVDLDFLKSIDVYDGFMQDDLIQYDYNEAVIETIRNSYNQFIKYNPAGVMNYLKREPKANKFKLVFSNDDNLLYYISFKNANNLLNRINNNNLLQVEELTEYLDINYKNIEFEDKNELINNTEANIYYYLDDNKQIKRFDKVFRKGFFINEEALNIILNV